MSDKCDLVEFNFDWIDFDKFGKIFGEQETSISTER